MTEFRFSEEYPYYVYVHYRNDNGQPFYVGMGKKSKKYTSVSSEYNRAYDCYDRNKYWKNIFDKVGRTVEIFMEDMDYAEACRKEMEIIMLYGRKKDGGTLCNINLGGNGNFGYTHTEQVKNKLKELSSITLDQRFERDIFPEPNTGCWMWAGPLDNKNRPVLSFNAKTIQAHRFLYEYEFKLDLTPSKFLFRECRNSQCVNPQHMSIKTINEIQQRLTELGVKRDSKKKTHVSDSLKNELIHWIKVMNFSQVHLMEAFGLSKAVFKRIVKEGAANG